MGRCLMAEGVGGPACPTPLTAPRPGAWWASIRPIEGSSRGSGRIDLLSTLIGADHHHHVCLLVCSLSGRPEVHVLYV